MDGIGGESFDLDIGRRFVIIVFFLVALWLVLNYFVAKIKSGQLKIPEFLTKNIPSLKNIDQSSYSEIYQMKFIQRQVMPDGSELLVLDVNGKHLLLSKHVNTGLQFITEL